MANLFAESASSFNGDAFGAYEKAKWVEFPCTQKFDYDRLRQEAESGDPKNPTTDNTNPGNNAVTNFLNKIKDRVNALPDSALDTCECKCCPKSPLDGMNIDIDYDGCCDCENDPECSKQIIINNIDGEPVEDECDFETACHAINNYAEQHMKDAGDFFSNLMDPNTESGDSGSLKNAIIRQVDLVLNRKCKRRQKGKFFFAGLNTQKLPDANGIGSLSCLPDTERGVTDAGGNPILS